MDGFHVGHLRKQPQIPHRHASLVHISKAHDCWSTSIDKWLPLSRSSNIEFTLDKFHHYLISKYNIGQVPSVAKMVTLDNIAKQALTDKSFTSIILQFFKNLIECAGGLQIPSKFQGFLVFTAVPEKNEKCCSLTMWTLNLNAWANSWKHLVSQGYFV